MINKCPICGGLLKLKNGMFGEFYGCDNYPKCKYTINITKVRGNPQNIKSQTIQVNDIVKLKNINTDEVVEYKIIASYIEYNDVFVGFGKYGPKHNSVIKNVYGGNPSDPTNPTISTDSPIGNLLLGKHVGDIITYGSDTYKILEHK